MVLLLQKFNKFYHKLENHHNTHKKEDEEALSAALRVFESRVSDFMNQLKLKPKPRSENLPFSWIKGSLELLPLIEQAFAKLVVEIDYPMSEWGNASVEEYLSYSLCMLDFFNLISSSISHLAHARLLVSHALCVAKRESLKPIALKIPINRIGEAEKQTDGNANRIGSGKEMVIHQALVGVKGIGFWVCGVVLSSLTGDAETYLQIKNPASGFSGSSFVDLDSGIFDGGSVVLKEVKEVNDAVDSLIAVEENEISRDEAAEELRRKLEQLEKVLGELGDTVDQLFSRTLARRNQLLDSIRLA